MVVKRRRPVAGKILEKEQLDILGITTHLECDRLPKLQFIRGSRLIAGIHQAGAKDQQRLCHGRRRVTTTV